MSIGVLCSCQCLKDRDWEITQYKCNHSAFNGYHWTPSDYSTVRCRTCGGVWRTKAKYVEDLPLFCMNSE
jgi:hypothetical protein